jgi:hypothetical protein
MEFSSDMWRGKAKRERGREGESEVESKLL